MAILTPGDRLTRESVPVEIRVHREAGPRSSVQEARESAECEHILRALEEADQAALGRGQFERQWIGGLALTPALVLLRIDRLRLGE